MTNTRNAFFGALSMLVTVFVGIYTTNLMLNTFGAAMHGFSATINNTLALVLSLIFCFGYMGSNGFFKPLNDHNQAELSRTYYYNKTILRRIAIVAGGIILIFAAAYPIFLPRWLTYLDTSILIIALALNAFINFVTDVDANLLTADYKSYIRQILYILSTILTAIVCKVTIQLGLNIHYVRLAMSAVLLIHPLFYWFYIRRHYQLEKVKVKVQLRQNFNLTNNTQRILTTILNRTDVFVLSIAANLTDVSVYAVYNMIGLYLMLFITSLFTGYEAVFGRDQLETDHNQLHRHYRNAHFAMANLTGIAFGITILFLTPFVLKYTQYTFGANYNQLTFGIILLLSRWLFCIRDLQLKFLYGTGHWAQMIPSATTETLINIAVSIILAPDFGLVGVAIGTLVAILFRVIYLFDYRQRKAYKEPLRQTIRRYLPSVILIALAIIGATRYEICPSDKWSWLIELSLAGMLFVVAAVILNLLINRRETIAFYHDSKAALQERNPRTMMVFNNIKNHIGTFCQQIVCGGILAIYYAGRWLTTPLRRWWHKNPFLKRALGAIRERGLISSVKVYFNHRQVVKFEAANPEMADIPYLQTIGQYYLGYKMNFDQPQTLNEKINWLKLFGRQDLYTMMSDKAAVKKYVAETWGPEHVIPTYGIYKSFDEIDFDQLPDAFVLKCTHDSGSIFVVPDKKTMDQAAARQKLEWHLNFKYWNKLREYAYRDVPPRIIAEAYMPSLGKRDSVEYRFMCFNGKVAFGIICQGYSHGFSLRRRNDIFDRNFNRLRWRAWYRRSGKKITKPAEWDAMVAISEKYAQLSPHLRVDLYVIDGQIYFGEFTFYTGGGFIEFHPKSMDLKLGKMLKLPGKE